MVTGLPTGERQRSMHNSTAVQSVVQSVGHRRATPADHTHFHEREKKMFHTIIIVGNLGKDPEMRYTPSGQAVTSFNVAANRQYTGADGNLVKETIWFRTSVWGKQAEACSQYLKKGSKVLVEGRLNADPQTGGPKVWQRQDGTSGASFEVTAQTVRFLSSNGDHGDHSGAGHSVPESAPSFAGEEPHGGDDSIPF